MDTPQRFDVNGVDVAYRRAGSGPPLVFFHGMGMTRRWLNFHVALAQRFDLVAPEHPGFGDTARPAWYRSLDDIAVHYADFLTALGLDEFHLVGHSLGGRIAASFAALYPERVQSLSLIAPAPLNTVSPADLLPPPDMELPPDGDFDGLLFNGAQAAYEEYRNLDDEGHSVAPDDGDACADPSAWSLETVPSLYRRLARVRCPAQVLVPEHDRVIPRECFEAWAHWLGDVPLEVVPGREYQTAHALIVQEPEAIADRVVALADAV